MYLSRLIIPIILMVILIGIFIINPFKNHITPSKIDDMSVVESLYQSNERNITVTADTLYYTGVDYRINDKIRGRFYYALYEGRCYLFLICEDKIADTSEPLTDFYIHAHLTHNDNMYKTIIASMSEELEFPVSNLEEITSGVIINQYDYVHSFETFSIYALNAFTIIVGINIIFNVFVLFNPYISIPFFKMRKYNKMHKIYALAEKEFNSSPAVYKDKVFITDSFFFGVTTASNLEIIPLENIVWIYKYKEFSSHNGKTDIQCPLCIVTDRKAFIKIPHIPNEISDEIIQTLQKRFPEIMVGDEKGTF